MVSKKDFDKGVKYLEVVSKEVFSINEKYKVHDNDTFYYHIRKKTIVYQLIRKIYYPDNWELNVYKNGTMIKYTGNTSIHLWFNIENNIIERTDKLDE